MVTGDSKEEVMIFRDKQTHMHHNIYIKSGYVGIDLYLLIIRGVTRGGTLDDSAFILISNSLIA